LVWFGEIERKLAKLSMTTFAYVLPLNYFMGVTEMILNSAEKADSFFQRLIHNRWALKGTVSRDGFGFS
jgi:hypothetical protein